MPFKLIYTVHGANIGMIQRRCSARLALKPFARPIVSLHFGREKLKRRCTTEPSIKGLIDDSHTARPDAPDDSIRACLFPNPRIVHRNASILEVRRIGIGFKEAASRIMSAQQ